MIQRISVKSTSRNQYLEITREVSKIVDQSGISEGIVVVYCPHTTAGITINENADPDVVRDMTLYWEKVAPKDFPGFRHAEGNSDSHIKASMVGSSATVIVDQEQLVLGMWQGIYLCEFDGPRTREVIVKVLGS